MYVKLEEDEIDWLLEKYPRFSYRKAPGFDGLLDVMFQPPK
jgi:hypothetical protein